mgnify:CR=1 FL=1
MLRRRYGSGLSFVRPDDYTDEEGEVVKPTPLYAAPPDIDAIQTEAYASGRADEAEERGVPPINIGVKEDGNV